MENSKENMIKLYEAVKGKKIEDKDDIYDIDSKSVIVDEDAIYIGFTAEVHDDDYGVDEREIEIDDILRRANELKEKLGLEGKPKLYTGTRAC
jgi:hypothetical protein